MSLVDAQKAPLRLFISAGPALLVTLVAAQMTTGELHRDWPALARCQRLFTRAVVCRIVLLAIVVATVALRIPPFVHGGFWRDEVATWLFANLPLGDVLPAIRDIDANPPGFYLIEWCVVHTVGATPLDLEIPSMVCAVLLVVLTYRLGKRLHSAAAGLLAACMIAIDPVAIREAADARCYTLLAVLCTWATLAVLRLRQDKSKRSALWLAAAASAAMYVHYTGIIYVAVLFAASLLGARTDRRSTVLLAIAASAAVLLYLPWSPAFILHQRVGYPILPSGLPLLARLRTLLDPLRAGLALWSAMLVVWLFRMACQRRPNAFDRRIAWAVTLNAGVQMIFLWRLLLHGRYAFVTLPLCYATTAAIAGECGSLVKGALPLRTRKFFFACVLLPMVMYGAASLRIVVFCEQSLSQPKSGVSRFAPTVTDRADTLVLAAPDYYAPTLAYALSRKKLISLDGFARSERPQWYRFTQGYSGLWSDPRAVDNAFRRIVRRTDIRTIFFVTQPSRQPSGAIDYDRSFTLLDRLEQRYRVGADTTYDGSWEPIRVVTLERRGR